MKVSPDGRLMMRSPCLWRGQGAVVDLGVAEAEVEAALVAGGEAHLHGIGAAQRVGEDGAAAGHLAVVGGQGGVLHAALQAGHRGGAEVGLLAG